MKKNRKPTATDIAYIAGIIDGEGCIMIRRDGKHTNSHSVVLYITNSDFGILKFIKERFGGSIYNQGRAVNKVIFQYSVGSKKAITLLKAVEKFSFSKKRQIKLACLFRSMKKGLSLRTKRWFIEKMKGLKRLQELPENM